MKNLVVLINGKKRNGKDHTAILLKNELEQRGYKVQIMSFAEPIKVIVASMLGISVEELETYKNDYTEYGLEMRAYPDNQRPVLFGEINFREILQRFGTEAMKPVFGDDVWAALLYKKAKESDADFVLVPDFRFNIEYNENATTINVFNKDIVSTDTHASETELDNFKFDWYIDNTGKPDLTTAIKQTADYIISKRWRTK